MKLSESIKILAEQVIQPYIITAKHCAEERHNSNLDNIGRASNEAQSFRVVSRIESICMCLGIKVMWPGLCPTFDVDGYQTHTFEDAVAMTFGCASIGILKEHEANGILFRKTTIAPSKCKCGHSLTKTGECVDPNCNKKND
jgi:hypothetical protein